MLLQIKSISIRNTQSINPMMLMKKRLVCTQTDESVAVVVRVDNRDDGLRRNIGKHECVFIPNPHPTPSFCNHADILYLVSVWLATLFSFNSSSIKCQNVPGK